MDKNVVKNAKELIKHGKSEEVIPLLKKELSSSPYEVSDLKKIGDVLEKIDKPWKYLRIIKRFFKLKLF